MILCLTVVCNYGALGPLSAELVPSLCTWLKTVESTNLGALARHLMFKCLVYSNANRYFLPYILELELQNAISIHTVSWMHLIAMQIVCVSLKLWLAISTVFHFEARSCPYISFIKRSDRFLLRHGSQPHD
jgi:hypothetical protein